MFTILYIISWVEYMCVCVYGVLIVYTIRLNMWCVPENRQKSDQSSPGTPSYISGVTMVSYWHWFHRPYYSFFTEVFLHPNYFSKVLQDCAMETKHASGVPAALFKVGIHLATQFLLTVPYIFLTIRFLWCLVCRGWQHPIKGVCTAVPQTQSETDYSAYSSKT